MFRMSAEPQWVDNQPGVKLSIAGVSVDIPFRTFLDIRDWFINRSDDLSDFFVRRAKVSKGENHGRSTLQGNIFSMVPRLSRRNGGGKEVRR